MKIKHTLLFLALLTTASVFAQKAKPDPSLPRPKLVVGLVVDQMRWDYLYRYYERYGNGGFKRMLNQGFSAENTYINYVPSVTAIGHATIYTGTVPAIHGIAGNDFIIQATGKNMYCVEDSTVETVGSTNAKAGKMSPKNLLATTMTDELKLATNFRAKVIGIALKDRGGILPVGRTADAAYWFDGSSGNFITSTYYMKSLPEWVSKFNAEKLPQKYLQKDWNTLYPIETYVQSTVDNSPYEGKFAGTESPTFPVKTSAMLSKGVGAITSTPYGSSLTLDLARAAIDNEELGKDAITDFLAVSISSPDYVGHQFGPNSIEAEDTYLRLDRDLETFFNYLDQKIGKGAYTVFLSADHAAAHNANFLIDNKIASGLYPTSALLKTLNGQLEQEYKVKNLIRSFSNYQVSLNYQAMEAGRVNEAELRKKIVAFLEKQEGVGFVVDLKNVQTATIPNAYRNQILNGHHPDRSGVIQVILKPGWYSGYSPTGTSHGTLSPFDTHIPFLLMGWGVMPGKSNSHYNMTDVAPTISALLRIQEPNGNIGKPVVEALK